MATASDFREAQICYVSSPGMYDSCEQYSRSRGREGRGEGQGSRKDSEKK